MCGILWAIYKKKLTKSILLFFKKSKKMESRWPNYTKVYQDKNMFFDIPDCLVKLINLFKKMTA